MISDIILLFNHSHEQENNKNEFCKSYPQLYFFLIVVDVTSFDNKYVRR